MITKKDIIALADALKESKPLFAVGATVGDSELNGKQWLHDVETIARAIAASNPQFKRDRFLSYIQGDCGKNGGRVRPSKDVRKRLEYLRQELRAERISYGELAELQSLAPYIDAADVELRQAANIEE